MPTRWDALHHLLAALTIAAGTVAVEHAGLLGWLDAAMLRMAATVPATAAPPTGVDTPALVLIDETSYVNDFALRSPLDREELRRGFKEILAARPEKVTVDLQLEPAVGETVDGENAQRPLDRLLREATTHTRIVLPLPETRSDALDRISLKWMRAMCDAGVDFAFPELKSNFGAIVRLPASQWSLTRAERERPTRHEKISEAEAHPRLCGLAKLVPSLRTMTEMLEHPVRIAPPGPAVRPSAVQRIWSQRIAWRPGKLQREVAERAAKHVVLGGGYDVRDTFLVLGSNEPMPGALVHAVAADPRSGAVENHFKAWAFDIFIGTLAGLCFQVAWVLVRIGQHPATSRIKAQFATPNVRITDVLWALVLGAWASLPALLLWAGVLAIGLGAMQGAARLLEQGMWLNPGPMILGMALHAQLLSQHGHVAVQPHDTPPHDPRHESGQLRTFLTAHPFAVWQSGLGAGAGLFLLISQLLHSHQ